VISPGRESYHVWFTRVCLEVRTTPFCVAILNSTIHSYSCRGEWLGGESDMRSCHKDDSKVIMIVPWTNLMCGSSVQQLGISLHSITSARLRKSDSSAHIQIIEFRRVFDYIVYICMISWSPLYCDATCFINIWYFFCKLAYHLLCLSVCLLCVMFLFLQLSSYWCEQIEM